MSANRFFSLTQTEYLEKLFRKMDARIEKIDNFNKINIDLIDDNVAKIKQEAKEEIAQLSAEVKKLKKLMLAQTAILMIALLLIGVL